MLAVAQRFLASRVRGVNVLTSPAMVKDFLRTRLGALPHEVFVVHLDAHHAVLDYVEMFRGTVTQTSVYPREVVKDALALNSSALLLVHCHPSGCAEPSRADEQLTQTLKQAAALLDVRGLDHRSSRAARSCRWLSEAFCDAGPSGLLSICRCEPYARGASASAAPSGLGSRLTDQWPPCSCRGASRS